MNFLRGKSSNEVKVKSYSWLFIIFALIEVVITVLNYSMGNFSSDKIMSAVPQITKEMVTTAIIVILVILGIKVLSLLFLGIKGLKELKKEKQGTGYIVFSRIVFVIYIISTIINIIGVINKTTDVSTALLNAFVVLVLYDFAESAKELSNKKNDK